MTTKIKTSNIQFLPTDRNLIINGDFQINQRVYSKTAASGTNREYGLDRWVIKQTLAGSGASWDAIQYTATAGGTMIRDTGSKTALRIMSNGTTSATLPTDNILMIEQRIKGNKFLPLHWGTSSAEDVTVSFDVFSNVTGTYTLSLVHDNETDTVFSQYVTSYTINSAATWERKEITIPGQTVYAIEHDYGDPNMFYSLVFNIFGKVETTNQRFVSNTEVDTWLSDDTYGDRYLIHPDQVDTFFDTTDNYFYITNVQLERGSSATPFERKDFMAQLWDCQEYYTKSYPYTMAPGTARSTAGNAQTTDIVVGRNYSDTARTANSIPLKFARPMRAEPNVTVYGIEGDQGYVSSCGGDYQEDAKHAMNGFDNTLGRQGAHGLDTQGDAIPATDIFAFHYTAEAEL